MIVRHGERFVCLKRFRKVPKDGCAISTIDFTAKKGYKDTYSGLKSCYVRLQTSDAQEETILKLYSDLLLTSEHSHGTLYLSMSWLCIGTLDLSASRTRLY